MNPKFICGFFLFLLFTHDQGRAKPITSVQTLSKLLEDDLEQPVGSEEMEQEQDETLLTGDVEQPDAPFQWYRSPREGLPLPEGSFQRLFSDLLASSRRIMPLGPLALQRDHPVHFVQPPFNHHVKQHHPPTQSQQLIVWSNSHTARSQDNCKSVQGGIQISQSKPLFKLFISQPASSSPILLEI